MGGLLIVASVLIPTLLWADLQNAYVWIAMLAMFRLRHRRLHRRLPQIVRRSHHGCSRATSWRPGDHRARGRRIAARDGGPDPGAALQYAAHFSILQEPDSGLGFMYCRSRRSSWWPGRTRSI